MSNKREKTDGRITTLWAIGVILLVMAVAFFVGWVSRGPRIHDFTGNGQAKILDITRYERENGDKIKIEYSYKVQITAGQETFTDRYNRSGRTDWEQGDVLPISYNINNPREYVIDITPTEYVRWYNKIGIITLGMMLGSVYCFGKSFRIKREIAAQDLRKQ